MRFPKLRFVSLVATTTVATLVNACVQVPSLEEVTVRANDIQLQSLPAITATVNTLFPSPVTVKVLDQFEEPMPDVAVNFQASSGAPASVQVQTNAQGIATHPGWTPASTSGSATITATVVGFAAAGNVQVTATVRPGAASQMVVVTQPSGAAAGAAITTVVELRDQFGNVVNVDPNAAGVTETISVAFTAGTNTEGATLGGTTTQAVNWANGRATFNNLTVNRVGSYSLTATTTNITPTVPAVTTTAFAITHGALNQLAVVTQPPANVGAGGTFTVVIEARDASGNPVTTNPSATLTERVTLAFTTGTNTEGALLGGTLTQDVDWTTGRATFNDLTVNALGNYSLTATDVNMPTDLTNATTSTFNVVPGAPSQLSVFAQPPTSRVAGVTFSAEFEVRDPSNNVITTDPDPNVTEQITLSFTTGTNTEGAILSGTLTQNVDWSTGRASFANLSVNLVGSYGLTATYTAASPNFTVNTNSFSITHSTATQIVFATQPPATIGAGTVFPATIVEVRDVHGNAVTTDPSATLTETITLAFTTGTNTEGATLGGTLTANVNWGIGRATFSNLSINLVGSYTLTASDANMPVNFTDPVSTGITVTAGPPAQLVFFTQPAASTAAGAAIPVVVEVRDGSGNAVTTDPSATLTETITLAFTAGTNTELATLLGTLTQNINWTTGRATFSVSVNKAGNYNITASDANITPNLPDANSVAFTITPAPPSELVVVTQPPTSTQLGQTFGAVVEVRDQFGFVVTADPSAAATETITMAFTAGTNTEAAQLSGTLTQNVDWATGRATFTNLSVNLVGNYSLTADDGGMPSNLTAVVTDAFNITGPPFQLAIVTQPPASTAAGTTITTVVEVRDEFGTPITFDPNGTVTEQVTVAFTAGSNTEGATLGGTLTQNVDWTTGRATFNNLTVNLTGTYALTATDVGMPTDLANSTTVNFGIVPAAPSTMVIITQPPATAQSGVVFPVVVELRDAFTNPITVDPSATATESITIGITSGTNTEGATLGGTLTQNIDFATGRATFNNLSVNLIGNYSLTAADNNLPTNLTDVTTNAFNVVAGPPAQMVFTTQPASRIINQATGMIVQVKDANGNNVTTDPNGAVTETITADFTAGTNTEGATLNGTKVLNVNWTNGQVVFTDLSITVAGNYSFTVADANMPTDMTNATTNAFNITGPPSQMFWTTQPAASTVAGVTMSSIVIEIRDAAGTPIVSDPNGTLTESVTIAFTAGTNTEGATLSGTLTQNVDWTTGRATFNNLSVNRVGNYSITGVDANMPSNLPDQTTTTFNITHAAATKISFALQPGTSIVAGASIPIEVEVRDQFDNPVTTDPSGTATETVTIAFTAGTNTEGATLTGVLVDDINWTNGKANFDLSVNRVGSYSFSAFESNITPGLTDATSSAFTITHGAPNKTAFVTQPPTSTTANSAFPIVVEVRDANDNPVTTDPNGSLTETIALSFTGGTNTEGATLNGGTPQGVNWTTGRATFSTVSVSLAGSFSLDAVDANMPTDLTPNAASNVFTVVGAPASLFVFTQPPASTANGVTFSTVIEVRDAAGQAVTLDPSVSLTESITVAFTAGTNTEGAVLGGTLTQNVNWTTGRATFSNLTVDIAGSYSLTATDNNMPTNLTDAVTSAFTITGPPPPSAPTNLVASGFSSSEISLSFSDNANDETGYKFERCAGASCVDFVEVLVTGACAGTAPQTCGITVSVPTSGTYNYRIRAFNAGGNSAYSNSSSAATLTDFIANGSFTTGNTSWTFSNNAFTSTTAQEFRTSPGYAHMGSSSAASPTFGSNSVTGVMFQDVAVPNVAGTPTLRFRTCITSEETSGVFDLFSADVFSTGNTLLENIETRNNTHEVTGCGPSSGLSDNGYTLKTFNLTAYKGQTIRIRFSMSNDSVLPSIFRVDDVQLVVLP